MTLSKSRENFSLKKGKRFVRTIYVILETLSLRNQLYVRGLLRGKGRYAAARAAGYAETTARNARSKLETADVQKAFREVLKEVCPLELIVGRIAWEGGVRL